MNTHRSSLSSLWIVFWWQDHEEQAARALAQDLWFGFLATATVTDPKTGQQSKVHAGNAKHADSFVIDSGSIEWVTSVIVFENNARVAWDLALVLNADHHAQGDAGYGLPAAQYFEASSLWQVMNYLSLQPNQEQRFIAAWDHCPADAYAGRCPWVDVTLFTDFRLNQKVAFYATQPNLHYKADKDILHALITKAQDILTSSPHTDNGIVDLRGQGMVDELPEAALMNWKAYMTSFPDTDRDRKPTGNTKVVLWWHTTPDMVEKFMEWGRSQDNVIDVYGDPIRWFAGVIMR
jgi:hypothetical protein